MTSRPDQAGRSTMHRVHLTARAPIGEAVVGCTGAVLDATTSEARAVLDITDGDGTQQLLEVVAGEEIALRSGLLGVERIHPWDPPHVAGVVLRWTPQEREGAAGGSG